MEELRPFSARLFRQFSKIIRPSRRFGRSRRIETLEDRTCLTTSIISLSPTLDDGLAATGTEKFVLDFSADVEAIDSAFQLTAVGPDALLGTPDDHVIDITSTAGTSSQITLLFAPLSQNLYRLTVYDSLLDSSGQAIDGDGDGVPGGDFIADFVTTPAVATSDVALVSGNSSVTGFAGNSSSSQVSVNHDGQFIAFRSSASNLVVGDNNFSSDIFVQNRSTGHIQRVSTDNDGDEVIGHSYSPDISDDGHVVAFRSGAVHLISDDANGYFDIFAKNLITGEVQLVSSNQHGEQANADSFNPSVSNDGRFVAFESRASNLVLDDTNNDFDIFVKDLETGFVRRVSTSINGNQATGNSYDPSITTDGQFVVFASAAIDLVPGDTNQAVDIFLKNQFTGSIHRVSTDNRNSQVTGDSYRPSVSEDGQYVAFHSFATDLVGDDENGVADVFVKHMPSGAIVRASVDELGQEPNGGSYHANLSHDGRTVSFYSYATNLTPNDEQPNADVYVKYLASGEVGLVSPPAVVENDGGNFYGPAISGNGQVVTFRGNAPGLHENSNTPINQIYSASLTAELATINLQMANGKAVTIDPAGFGTGQIVHGSSGVGDALNRLFVDAVPFEVHGGVSPADEGRSVETELLVMSDLLVSRKVSVPNVGEYGFVRTIDSFENTSDSDVFASVRIVGNVGSDSGTNVFATSDGDNDVEVFDEWIGTRGTDESMPSVVHYIRGPGDELPTSVELIGDNIVWEFDVTVPAGETVRLATFTIAEDQITSAIDAANTLVTASGFSKAAAAFMTNAEIESLANYSFVSDFGDAPDTYGTSLAADGARHSLSANLFMGSGPPDGELDGFGDGLDDHREAQDDDIDGRDDEDALATVDELHLEIGEIPRVSLVVTNQTGVNANLVGWIDFDNDGSFSVLESAMATVPPESIDRTVTLVFSRIISDYIGSTFARFRLTTDPEITRSRPTGIASDGEVEDHVATILRPSVSLSLSDTTRHEGEAAIVTITATTSQPIVHEQVVRVLETGADFADYQFASRLITIPQGASFGTTSFAVIDDEIVEATEIMTIRLVEIPDDLRFGSVIEQEFQILDDDQAIVSIEDVTLPEGDAGTTDFVFQVTLDQQVDTPVVVDFTTVGATAVPGSDYVSNRDGTLVFPANSPPQTTLSFTIHVIGDESVEPTNVFYADIQNLLAPGRTVSLGNVRAQGAIWNDDESKINVGVSSASVLEDSRRPLVYTFTRDRTTDETPELTVNFGIGGTAGFDDISVDQDQAITFLPGQQSTSIAVHPLADNTVESEETVAVTVLAGPQYRVGDTGVATASILNDDLSTVSVVVSQPAIEEDSESLLAYTFSRTRVSHETPELKVDITISGSASASDYVASSANTVTFARGSAEAVLLIDPIGDTVVEPNETIFVTTESSRHYLVSSGSSAATILNDDTATITFESGALTGFELDSGTREFVFTATLDNPVDGGFEFVYSTNDGTATAVDDYIDNDGTLFFTGIPGEEHTVFIEVSGDELVERDEVFVLSLDQIQNLRTGIDPATVSVSQQSHEVTILNDDTSTISIQDVRNAEGSHDAVTVFEFDVTMSSIVDTQVEFIVDTQEGSATSGSDFAELIAKPVALPSGMTATTVVVNVTGDDAPEPEETFSVLLSALDAGGRDVAFADFEAIGAIPRDDVGLFVLDGELSVYGSDNGDVIVVRETGSGIEVELNGASLPTVGTADLTGLRVMSFSGEDEIDVRLTELSQLTILAGSESDTMTVEHSGLSELYGGSGNDTITGGSGPNEIHGGSGDDRLTGQGSDDTIFGGSGADELFGSRGNDVLSGNAGDDKLVGSSGRDILLGGAGFDELKGGSDDDVLIGSMTTADNDVIAIALIQSEWTSEDPATARVSALRSGGLALSSITNDFDRDLYAHGSGEEWAVYALDEILKDTPEFFDIL